MNYHHAMENTTVAAGQYKNASNHGYTFDAALAASERVNWRIEDIIGGDKKLDFAKPFLPESLARVEPLTFLNADEQRILNQIRGHGYLYTFGLVEEFILPFVLDHVRPQLDKDDAETRAYLQFATEEAKHIHLFKRFREEFEKGFRVECQVIGPPEAVAQEVLSKHPLGTALVILHIEWMTQRHYTDSVRDNRDMDPQFKSLLKHHWMEEAQHAKLDTLMIESMVANGLADQVEEGIEGYLAIGGFLDEGLKQQAEFDMEALQKAIGRVFNAEERQLFLDIQHQALRWTFLGTGMTHQNFLGTVENLNPGSRKFLESVSPQFC